MNDTDLQVKTATEVELKQPNLWKVILLNDEITTMEFVIEVLTRFFEYTEDSAMELTLKIHEDGSAVAAVYPYELAEQKGIEVTLSARQSGYPLEVRIEEDV
jgi:ATP-dependent Clp protease adaptor protein ClpS